MKKIISVILAVAMLLSFASVTYAAYELPSEFWPVNTAYANALDANDYDGIITYGLKALEILEKEPENDTTIPLLGARYEKVAFAYDMKGDYAKSLEMYKKALPYAEARGWTDSVKIDKAKILQYTPQIELYSKTTETQVYYGAKNEPEKGVYYGITSDGKSGIDTGSMMLLYAEYGDTYFDWYKACFNAAREKGQAVLFALNVVGEGSAIDGIINDTVFINQLMDFLSQYKDVKMYVRFGGEMNIWTSKCEPAKFIQAFRKVADAVHSRLPNAAMVFSPYMVSEWSVNMDDFYPGDEYVDWVGLSLYLQKYFLGRNDWRDDQKYNEVVFLTGHNANAVTAIDEVMKLYGGRKPIMVSESGSSHYINALSEDATPWAADRMRKMYWYLPMVYPQVKLIAHFDKFMGGEKNDFSLSASPELTKLYRELTSEDAYIQLDDKGAGEYTYKHWGNTIYCDSDNLELYCYAHVYSKDNLRVLYEIDGAYAASSTVVPYRGDISLKGLWRGNHTLKVSVMEGNTVLNSRTYTLNNEKPIRVTLDGKEIAFDQKPIMENDRVLVPLRAIFEALGAEVSYDGVTRTVYAEKDGIKISLGIGENILYINDRTVELDVPAKIVNDRTLVPVRAISESFGVKVDWSGEEYCVILGSK